MSIYLNSYLVVTESNYYRGNIDHLNNYISLLGFMGNSDIRLRCL